MAKQNLYNVFDNAENKQIGTNLTNAEVNKLLGTKNVQVRLYLDYSTRIQGRYSITLGKELFAKNNMPAGFWEEWDKMYEVAQMIRSGKGKIVTEVIEARKYTVPIGE